MPTHMSVEVARSMANAGAPPNKAMKLTSLSAAPGLNGQTGLGGGAASYPRWRETAGTGSQLIASIRPTSVGRMGGSQVVGR